MLFSACGRVRVRVRAQLDSRHQTNRVRVRVRAKVRVRAEGTHGRRSLVAIAQNPFSGCGRAGARVANLLRRLLRRLHRMVAQLLQLSLGLERLVQLLFGGGTWVELGRGFGL